MKKLMLSGLLSVLFLSATFAQRGTQRSGYEGDYFSLEGAIELFKRSNSIKDFERRLNTEDTWVNNLDLNYDGRIDYIRVEHIRQGNFHAIVLQAPINEYDVQDIAVIEIEKTGRREAMLQIVGDEDIYGEETIVEPIYNAGYSSGRGGPYSDYHSYQGFVNVYYWSAVQHILGRRYRPYISPYRWHYYPTWWSPWRQCAWNIYRPRVVIYHHHHHVVHVHRVHRVHTFYRPYRNYCPNVLQRSNQVRVKHGKSAVHRAAVNKNKSRKDFQKGNSQIHKKDNVSPSRAKVQREKATPQPQRSTPRVDRQSRNNTQPQRSDNRGNVRTSPSRTTPSSKPNRSTPKIEKQRSNSPSRKSTTRSATPNRQPTAKPQRSTSKMNKSRSVSPSKSNKTRTTTPSRKPAAKPQRSTSKVNKSKSASPSRSSTTRSSSSSKKSASRSVKKKG